MSADCIAHREGRVDEVPAPRPRKSLPRRQVVVLLIERDGRVLLERRPNTGVWPGLLGLPELPVDADVVHAVTTRLGVPPLSIERLPGLTHVFTHFALDMQPVRVIVAACRHAAGQAPVEWLPRNDVADAAVPTPVRTLLLRAP